MGIGGDEIGNADAAFFEAGEEGAPVGFGLGDSGGDAQDEAFGVVAADADGGEDGAVAHGPVEANLDVGGVEDEEGDLGQGAGAPFFELGIELGGEARDLGGGDVEPTEFLDDGFDAACGNALEIHFGHGRFEGAIHAGTAFQKRGAEGLGSGAGLWDQEIELSRWPWRGSGA